MLTDSDTNISLVYILVDRHEQDGLESSWKFRKMLCKRFIEAENHTKWQFTLKLSRTTISLYPMHQKR